MKRSSHTHLIRCLSSQLVGYYGPQDFQRLLLDTLFTQPTIKLNDTDMLFNGGNLCF